MKTKLLKPLDVGLNYVSGFGPRKNNGTIF